jgi:hypothetical protein
MGFPDTRRSPVKETGADAAGGEYEMRRATLLVLLSAFLLASPASPLDQIWSFLVSIASTGPAPDPAPTADEGCGLDPSGNPRCAPGS